MQAGLFTCKEEAYFVPVDSSVPQPSQACRCLACLEEMMSVVQARAANYQRKKILKRNAGIAPQAGHEDYKWYRQCCKACKNYY